MDGVLEYGALKNKDRLIFAAIELPHSNVNDRIVFVDIDAASAALDEFRQSVENASAYERGWNRSGIPKVLEWLSSSSSPSTTMGALNPDLDRLIESILDAAEQEVHTDEAKRIADREAHTVSDEIRASLNHSVSAWAEQAHKELRDSLERAFSSKRWGGLAWWKLFWRVDDVGMVSAEVLKSSYLRSAERHLIWVSGRIQQAGLTGDVLQPHWPAQISTSCDQLAKVNVPSLQALAQRLVLHSLSTITLMSSISVLTYVSVPTASVYEASTLAALGLIYSLRRQQKRWAPARAVWEEEVREFGRTSLRDTEQDLRAVIRDGGRPVEPVENESADSLQKIKNARRALKEAK